MVCPVEHPSAFHSMERRSEHMFGVAETQPRKAGAWVTLSPPLVGSGRELCSGKGISEGQLVAGESWLLVFTLLYTHRAPAAGKLSLKQPNPNPKGLP